MASLRIGHIYFRGAVSSWRGSKLQHAGEPSTFAATGARRTVPERRSVELEYFSVRHHSGSGNGGSPLRVFPRSCGGLRNGRVCRGASCASDAADPHTMEATSARAILAQYSFCWFSLHLGAQDRVRFDLARSVRGAAWWGGGAFAGVRKRDFEYRSVGTGPATERAGNWCGSDGTVAGLPADPQARGSHDAVVCGWFWRVHDSLRILAQLAALADLVVFRRRRRHGKRNRSRRTHPD